MRRILCIMALALLLVATTVDLGQSRSRPYDIADLTNGSGSTADDHPWGGDNSGGGGTNGSGLDPRPTLIMSTGNPIIDYFTTRFLRSGLFLRWQRQVTTTGETTTSTTGTTVPSNTQAN